MSPAEIEALVEQVGDEILGRLGLPAAALEQGLPPEAPASSWPRPQAGYASALELVCDSPQLDEGNIVEACRRARETGLPVVWTAPSFTATAVRELVGAATRAGALIDFPNGAGSTPARLADIETALRLGAGMITLSFASGRLHSGSPEAVRVEAQAAANLCADADAALAITLEASHLAEPDLAVAAAAAIDGGADALCSSTGRLSHGYCSDRAVAVLREIAGDRAAVIAAGRIAGFGHAAALIAAGADRVASEDPWALLATAPAQ